MGGGGQSPVPVPSKSWGGRPHALVFSLRAQPQATSFPSTPLQGLFRRVLCGPGHGGPGMPVCVSAPRGVSGILAEARWGGGASGDTDPLVEKLNWLQIVLLTSRK